MPSTARTHQLSLSLAYHVMNRGNEKSVIFHEEKDYLYFIKILQNYTRDDLVSIYHWVLMPNHYHLLLEINMPEKLSKVMAGIARSYVHYHHKKYDSAGHLWQGRFKSQPVEKERYFLSCGRYIERNPVKAGLVRDAEDYPYSSARYYVSHFPDGLTTSDPLFDTFGGDIKEQAEGYRTFLRAFDAEEEERFERFEILLGSAEFRGKLIKTQGHFFPRRRGRPRTRIYS